MEKEEISVLLSGEEAGLIKSIATHNIAINSLTKKIGLLSDGRGLLLINSKQREDMRTILTELLAEIGFNDDYSLTRKGEILEEIIDRLCDMGTNETH